MIFWPTLIVTVATLLALAYCFGYHHGVEETERRWSDAVGRARHQ